MKQTDSKIELINSETIKNLARAFAGECQAGARYQFAATLAEQEKFSYIKSLLKIISKNEMAHAKVFYDHITKNNPKKQIIKFDADYPYFNGTLLDNLNNGIEAEKNEMTKIYPDFEKIARKEGFIEIADSFKFIATVEECHMKTLKTLSDGIKNGNLYNKDTEIKWKCSNCGYEHTGKDAWKTCPLCYANQGYVLIDISE